MADFPSGSWFSPDQGGFFHSSGALRGGGAVPIGDFPLLIAENLTAQPPVRRSDATVDGLAQIPCAAVGLNLMFRAFRKAPLL